MLDSILTAAGTASLDLGEMLLCTGTSLVLGLLIALVYRFRNPKRGNFVATLALLPALVQTVIILVNGNLGAGVAVAGAFSLVRFRSIPGSAREIGFVFFAMAIGLATGMGYLTYAALFTVILCVVMIAFSLVGFGGDETRRKSLKITIPEDLDYADLFEDLFREFTRSATLERVKTTNLGSLYELQYLVELREIGREKEFIDQIRCRNGNLNITCGKVPQSKEEL